jgi:hypothetical protein
MRLAERPDLAAENRLGQIAGQCREALEREPGDGEVIAQLKATVTEYKNKAIDLIVSEKELGLAQAQLASSERARKQIEAQLKVADLSTGQMVAHRRLEDLGCALCYAHGNENAIGLSVRALKALAKRSANELDADELHRRGLAVVAELLED